MPNTVFINPELEKEFNLKGYVSVPFLSAEEVESLKQQFFDTIEQSGGPKTSGNVDYDSKSEISYDFTFIDKNSDYKKKVFDIITQKFQPIADKYLNNYKPIIANYIRKKQDGGEVPMHQNWAFVDEVKYTSVSIWVPLVDSNEENGTLQMVDGSHKKFGQHRGPMVPWELRHLTKEIVAKHLTPMNVKAGQGVILDDSIVHYSNINKTPGLRLAIQLIMIPKEAKSIHYHLDRELDPNNIHVLETNVDFYTYFHPWLKPQGVKQLATIKYTAQDFTYQEFLEGMKAERFDKNSEPLKIAESIPALFKDSLLQDKFEKDGYVKVPLLNAVEIEELKQYYHSLKHEHIGEYGFHVSLDSTNKTYIEGVFDKLFATLNPKLKPILSDYKSFTASYVTKEAGLKNIVPPHQDWTFVDESKYCSATVWVPLLDVNKNNGALGVIKGSHNLFHYPRVSPSPQAKSVLSDHLMNLFPYVEVMDMKAGEALIFNNKTIHASPPNISGITRLGVGIGITQKNADLLHYYELPDKETVEVYRVNENFFKEFNNSKLSELYKNGEKPSGLEKINSFKKVIPTYTKDEIIKLVCSTEGVEFNTSLMSELAGLYNYNLNGKPNHQENEAKEQSAQTENRVNEPENAETVWVDTRSFFEKYTISNIVGEIKHRLGKKG